MPSVYRVPKDPDASAWAQDALAYAEETAQPDQTSDMTDSPLPSPFSSRLKFRVFPPDGIPAVNSFGETMGQLPVSGTEAQVEARMRNDLGIERWEAYGLAWFDSLVDGFCIRR